MAMAEVHENQTGEPRKSAAPGVARGVVRTGWGVGRMVRQVWLAGLGAMATTGEEGAHLFQVLVRRGQEVEPNLQVGWNRLRDEVTSKLQWTEPEEKKIPEPGKRPSSRLRSSAPERSEVEHLTHRVEELTARLNEMDRSRPARSAAKKPPAASTRIGSPARTRRARSRAGR